MCLNIIIVQALAKMKLIWRTFSRKKNYCLAHWHLPPFLQQKQQTKAVITMIRTTQPVTMPAITPAPRLSLLLPFDPARQRNINSLVTIVNNAK